MLQSTAPARSWQPLHGLADRDMDFCCAPTMAVPTMKLHSQAAVYTVVECGTAGTVFVSEMLQIVISSAQQERDS